MRMSCHYCHTYARSDKRYVVRVLLVRLLPLPTLLIPICIQRQASSDSNAAGQEGFGVPPLMLIEKDPAEEMMMMIIMMKMMEVMMMMMMMMMMAMLMTMLMVMVVMMAVLIITPRPFLCRRGAY